MISYGNETAVLGLDVSSWMHIMRDLVDGCYVFRNQHQSSSSALLRRDGVVEVGGSVVVIVESKGSVTQGGIARSELIDKLHPLAYKKFPLGSLSIMGITTTDTEIINMYSLIYNPTSRIYSSDLYKVTELAGRRAFITDVFKVVCWMRTVRCSGCMATLPPEGFVPNMDLIRRLYQADLPNVERGIANCSSVTITSIDIRVTDAVRSGVVAGKDDVVHQVRAAVEQIHCDICVENLFVLDSDNAHRSGVRQGSDDREGARCEPARAPGGIIAPGVARLGVSENLCQQKRQTKQF
eukprot:gene34814-42162_t